MVLVVLVAAAWLVLTSDAAAASTPTSSQPIGEANNPEHMQQLIDMVGTDSLMFATDYPHWDFDHPDALDKQLRMRFDAEDRKRILHGNASEFFDLGI